MFRGNQWGQTYTFDKMWIIDRSLLTLEKYDLENNWGQTYTFDIMPCFHMKTIGVRPTHLT